MLPKKYNLEKCTKKFDEMTYTSIIGAYYLSHVYFPMRVTLFFTV